MNKLIIIRGLPGSGKSTLAKSLSGFVHLEADMYFDGPDGYTFEGSRIKDAHAWCQREVLSCLEDGNDVVVSNTFTQHWEMKPYLEIAQQCGASVQVVICKGNFKNVHGVPEEKIREMADRWED